MPLNLIEVDRAFPFILIRTVRAADLNISHLVDCASSLERRHRGRLTHMRPATREGEIELGYRRSTPADLATALSLSVSRTPLRFTLDTWTLKQEYESDLAELRRRITPETTHLHAEVYGADYEMCVVTLGCDSVENYLLALSFETELLPLDGDAPLSSFVTHLPLTGILCRDAKAVGGTNWRRTHVAIVDNSIVVAVIKS